MANQKRPGAESLQTNETVLKQREGKVSGTRLAVRSSQRVLIVDVNSDALAFMAFALRRHGHAVVLADSVQSAMMAASIQSFDVVVTTLALRDGTGMTLLKMLQEKSPIRGIALAEDGCDDNVVLDAGFEFKLQKPVPIATLTHAVLALGS